MKELNENIWDHLDDLNTYICITTNGSITNNKVIMGRGIALQAKNMFRGLDKEIADKIRIYGLTVFKLNNNLISFPVKYEWFQKANLDLIRKSLTELIEIANIEHSKYFLLPRPGCGNGGRNWKTEIKPLIENMTVKLPNNIFIINND